MQNELMDTTTWKQEPPLTVAGVLAVWLQNFGGGLGAAVLVGVLAWQFGVEPGAGLRWALIAWAVVFGGLMVLRSAIDEIVDVADYRRLIGDLEAAEEQVDLLEQRCAALERSVRYEQLLGATTRKAGEVVMDRNGQALPYPADAPVRNDARTLIQLHFESGVWPAKDATCQKLAWTTTRWAEARDELQRYGVVVTVGKRTVVQAQSLAEALAMLDGDVSR